MAGKRADRRIGLGPGRRGRERLRQHCEHRGQQKGRDNERATQFHGFSFNDHHTGWATTEKAPKPVRATTGRSRLPSFCMQNMLELCWEERMTCRCPYCSTRLQVSSGNTVACCPYCATSFEPARNRPFPTWIWGVLTFLAVNALLRLFYP